MDEGRRRVEQLAYASGVLAAFRQEQGTLSTLSDAAWLRIVARVPVCGAHACAIWLLWFEHGYEDAQRRLVRAAPQSTRYVTCSLARPPGSVPPSA
ncbi:MAG: hypothetical protein H0X37_22155 [Herpetosiphonaceae bacterium]|nr:hypothetical protein [Herpetosiphonaceae bacterium]